MEKLLFRALMLSVLGALALSVLASLDDIKRYVKIRSM